MSLLTSLNPVTGRFPRVLILGSMPGQQSLLKQQYYGNPRNHFWPLMSNLLNTDLTGIAYDERLKVLTAHGIALWDVVHSCEREGSLDSAIKKETPNNLQGLLKEYPSIKCIGLNGTKAYQSFNKYRKTVSIPDIKVRKLPSTSPVPGRNVKSFEEKVEIWSEFINYE